MDAAAGGGSCVSWRHDRARCERSDSVAGTRDIVRLGNKYGTIEEGTSDRFSSFVESRMYARESRFEDGRIEDVDEGVKVEREEETAALIRLVPRMAFVNVAHAMRQLKVTLESACSRTTVRHRLEFSSSLCIRFGINIADLVPEEDGLSSPSGWLG